MKKLIVLILFLLSIPLAQALVTSTENVSGVYVPSITAGAQMQVTIPLILLAGLIDSINPCAFAVMIFLLACLIAISKRLMLKVGIVYIATVYITYFLAGLGILTAIQTTGISSVFYLVAAAIAIFAGLISVKDYFYYDKWLSLKIPASKKPLIKKLVSKASVPSAIVLGFLVSAFELPCTGGVYFAILAMLAANSLNAVGYLLIYNFMFVLPLIAILAFGYYGMKIEKMKRWKESKKRLMKLLIGIFLLILGIMMLIR